LIIGVLKIEKWNIHIQKKEIGSLPYNIYKINSQSNKDLNTRPKAIKCLEENLGENFVTLGLARNSEMGYQSVDNKSKRDKFVYQRSQSTEHKGNLQNGRKYLQIIQLLRS